MTNRTAQAEIAAVAAAHGWTHSGGQRPTLSRGDVVVELWFTRSGAVHGATRRRPGQPTDRPARDRRNAVLSWLTAEPAQSADQEAQTVADAVDAAQDAEVRAANEAARAVPAGALPIGTRVQVVGFAPDNDGLTGLVAGYGTGEWEGWTWVDLDRRGAGARALGYRHQYLVALPEPTVSLVKRQPTDRDRIMAAGTAGDWALYATSSREHGYRRGAVMVSASFTEDGALVTGSLRVDGVRTPLDTQRASWVVIWLEEVADHQDAQGAEPAADPEPVQVDHLDEVDPVALAERVAELEALLEAEVAAHARTRALVKRKAAQISAQAEGYRKLRERVTELEDARGPARGRFHDLVHELSRSIESAPATSVFRAAARLGQALGVPAPYETQLDGHRRPFADSVPYPAPGRDPRDGARPSFVLVDEVVPEVVGAPEPRTVREALELDGHISGPIPALLPGQTALVQGHDLRSDGPPVGRVYGTLYRRPDGVEVLLTAAPTATVQPAVVPVHLVLPYLAAARGEGFPGPSRRAALLEDVKRSHGTVDPAAVADWDEDQHDPGWR